MGRKNNREDRKAAVASHLLEMSTKCRRETEYTLRTAKQYSSGLSRTKTFSTPRYSDTEIIVDATDTVSAISDTGSTRMVLDFASFHNPGGGYLNGSLAQEEALCSASNLYLVLEQFQNSFYQPHKRQHNQGLYTSDCLYLPSICFYKNDILYLADTLVIAAPNAKAAYNNNVSDYEIEEAMQQRIDTILNVALDNEVDDLILGAFGCGVFGNSAYDVAEMFRDGLEERRGQFRKVVFAVPDGDNLAVFREVFELAKINYS